MAAAAVVIDHMNPVKMDENLAKMDRNELVVLHLLPKHFRVEAGKYIGFELLIAWT